MVTYKRRGRPLNPARGTGRSIRRERERAGLTVQQLADRLGVSRWRLLRLEAGSVPPVDVAIRLTQVLPGLALRELVAESDRERTK